MGTNESGGVSTRNLSVNVTTDLSSVATLPEKQSLYGADVYNKSMRDYVPNESFAKLLNKDGEIMVGNIIYKITPNGTYYFDKDKKLLFDKLYSRDSTICGTLVEDKLYKIIDGIFRYDTYWYMDEKYLTEVESDFIIPTVMADDKTNQAISLRNYGAEPDYNSFPTFKNTKENIFGFIIKNIIGNYKAHTQYYDGIDDRRVKGEFYENDHVFYSEIGAKGWTDKKNWIGWSKTDAAELRVGWDNVVLVSKLPDYLKQQMQEIKKIQQAPMHSRPEYQKIPGSTYSIETSTLVIPGLNESELKKNINKGAKFVYDYLKSIGSTQSQSDWNRSKASAIASETNIYYVIKNESVKKFNEDYYCHVFASQGKAGITLTPNSFSGNWLEMATKLAISIFKESSNQITPTLYGGRVFVAARFGNEWQGMNMVKEAK